LAESVLPGSFIVQLLQAAAPETRVRTEHGTPRG